MIEKMDTIKNLMDLVSPCFNWLRWFYPKAKGIHPLFLMYFFIPQKVFRINGCISWPVHYTTRVLFRKNISVGAHSAPGMTGNCYIQARNGIVIGSNLRMGPGVGLISANHKEDDYDIHVKEKPIVIGDNVWIGMNSVVLAGVTIGSNVIIGANSVVNKSLPSNVVAAGNPCRIIREKAPYNGIDYTRY